MNRIKKKIIAVQHQDGTKEFLCPKCNTVMIYGDDFHESLVDGEYKQSGGEYFYCPNCELVIR